MPGIGIKKPFIPAVNNTAENSHILIKLTQAVPVFPVYLLKHFAGEKTVLNIHPEPDFGHGHDKSRGNTVSAHICDNKSNAVIGECDNIIKITSEDPDKPVFCIYMSDLSG